MVTALLSLFATATLARKRTIVPGAMKAGLLVSALGAASAKGDWDARCCSLVCIDSKLPVWLLLFSASMLKIPQVHCIFTSLLASTIFATAFLMLRMFDPCYSSRSHSHPRNLVFYRIWGLQRHIFLKKPGFSPLV